MFKFFQEFDWTNPTSIIISLTVQHLFWGILFYSSINLINLQGIEKKTANCIKQKFVALIHDIFIVFFPLYAFTKNGFHLVGDPEPETIIINITGASYFTMHLVIVLAYKISSISQVLHHIFTVFALYGTLFIDTRTIRIGSFYLFSYQLSHLPLHTRAILKDLGMRYTKFYEIVEMAYFGMYIFERLAVGTYVTYALIYEVNAPFIIYFGPIFLWFQSVYFCFQMALLTLKKIEKYRERCEKKVDYFWFETNKSVVNLSYYKNEGKEKVF